MRRTIRQTANTSRHEELERPVERHKAGDVIERTEERIEAMMARYLGTSILHAFADDDVTEIYTNPHDTLIRLDTRSRGRVATDVTMAHDRVLMFLDCVAMAAGVTLGPNTPTVSAELPDGQFRKARVQGFIPPITRGPAFAIRKPPAVIYSLQEYLDRAALTPLQLTVLKAAVRARENVLVVGATNSGKTTFANAIIREIAEQCPHDRLIILEDTVELQCASPDHLALRTQPGISLRSLVKATLRASPNRIVVGEVRDEAALDLLDAWATGHSGGVATFHATDAQGALHRLDRLAQRANVPSQRHLIAEAVHLVVVLEHDGDRRRIREIVRVEGLDSNHEYRLDGLSSVAPVHTDLPPDDTADTEFYRDIQEEKPW